MALAPGARVADRYRIEDLLGEGGMGSVHAAWDERLEKRVALKVARPGLPAAVRARFEREARIGDLLGRESGFVRVLDWGDAGDVVFVAMDLIAGARPLEVSAGPPSARLARVRRAAELVAEVHRRGVVHRDIKPANFLEDTEGRILLTDFGLAKAAGAAELPEETITLTHSGFAMGTPHFMPPEQFEDTKDVDGRADVFALGVMLFLALTGGRYPYEGSSALQLIQRQQRVLAGRAPAPRLRDHLPQATPALEAVCARALALEREARFGSASELLAALEAALPGDVDATLDEEATRRAAASAATVDMPATPGAAATAPLARPNAPVMSTADVAAPGGASGEEGEGEEDAPGDAAPGAPPERAHGHAPALAADTPSTTEDEPGERALALANAETLDLGPAPGALVVASLAGASRRAPRPGLRRARRAVASALAALALTVATGLGARAAQARSERAVALEAVRRVAAATVDGAALRRVDAVVWSARYPKPIGALSPRVQPRMASVRWTPAGGAWRGSVLRGYASPRDCLELARLEVRAGRTRRAVAWLLEAAVSDPATQATLRAAPGAALAVLDTALAPATPYGRASLPA